MGFGKKKRGLILFALISVLFIFLFSNTLAENVRTAVVGTKTVINITDATNLYSYEINFANPGGGSSVVINHILGRAPGWTSGTNLKSILKRFPQN